MLRKYRRHTKENTLLQPIIPCLSGPTKRGVELSTGGFATGLTCPTIYRSPRWRFRSGTGSERLKTMRRPFTRQTAPIRRVARRPTAADRILSGMTGVLLTVVSVTATCTAGPPEPAVLPATVAEQVAVPAGTNGDAYLDPSTGEPSAVSVLRAFDKPEHNWLPGHRGVDLALSVGGEVRAAGAGIVAFAGPVAGTPVISIDHADGIRTTYQPVYPRVSQGGSVAAGDVIGTLAPATDGWPGLHWGARRDESYLNPLGLLAAPIIRLKPVDAPAGTPRGGAAR